MPIEVICMGVDGVRIRGRGVRCLRVWWDVTVE